MIEATNFTDTQWRALRQFCQNGMKGSADIDISFMEALKNGRNRGKFHNDCYRRLLPLRMESPEWDLENICSYSKNSFDPHVQLNFTNGCWTPEKQEWYPLTYAVIAVLCGILTTMLLSTWLNSCDKRKSKKMDIANAKIFEYEKRGVHVLLNAFSIKENIRVWTDFKVNERHLKCIDGIRFLSMSWIILAFTFLLCPIQISRQLIQEVYPKWSMYLVFTAHFASDTFFTLSGLLLTYRTLASLERKESILKPFFRRLFRFLPAYTIVIFTSATIIPFLRENNYLLHSNGINCRENWWTNLLFINNIVLSKSSTACHQETWYLAADMQFFVVSLILVYLLWASAKAGLVVIFGLLLGAIAFPTAFTAANELIPSPVKLIFQSLTPSEVDEYVDFYIKPWNRGEPYLVGILGGYFLHHYYRKNGENPQTRRVAAGFAVVGWAISTIVALALIYGLHLAHDGEDVVPKTQAAAYGGLHSLCWSVVVVWTVIACSCGCGGWINDLLAWNIFLPLSRLTFCVFIVCTNVQLVFHLFTEENGLPSTLTMTGYFFAHLIASLIVAFILHVVVQAPFVQMGNFMMKSEAANESKERKRIPRERYGLYYMGTNMEVKVNIGEFEKNAKAAATEKRQRPTVRYGLFYDGLNTDAVIQVQR